MSEKTPAWRFIIAIIAALLVGAVVSDLVKEGVLKKVDLAQIVVESDNATLLTLLVGHRDGKGIFRPSEKIRQQVFPGEIRTVRFRNLAGLGDTLQFQLQKPVTLTIHQLLLYNARAGTTETLQGQALADLLRPAEVARNEIITQTGEEPGAVSVWLRSMMGFNPQWRSNMDEIQQQQSPEASFPPALQWTDRDAIVFPFTNMVLYGMGITAGLTAWAGLFWALWRIVRGRPDWLVHAIPVSWSLVYFLFMGTRWVKSIRYFLPIYPTLFLLGGWALWALWQRASQSENRRVLQQGLAAVLMTVVIIPSFLWANAFIQIYKEPVTRIAASEWMFENIPTGATLLYEANGESKTYTLPLKGYDFQVGGNPLYLPIILPEDGTITAVRFNKLFIPLGPTELRTGQSQPITMQAGLLDGPTEATDLVISETEASYEIALPETAVTANSAQQLVFQLTAGNTTVRAQTSLLMNEHWDGILPFDVNGRSAYGAHFTEITGGQRPITNPDNPQKREEMVTWLEEADYVVLSSQRAVWSLPRLPLTYPMTTRYYEALFSGELGFELVAEFHAPLKIGPLYISDTTGQVGLG